MACTWPVVSTRCQRRRRRICRSRSVNEDATSRTSRSFTRPGRRPRREDTAVMHNHPYSRGSPLAAPQRLSPARTRHQRGSSQEWRENGAHNGAPNGRGERPPSRASASQRPVSGSSCQADLPVRRAPRPPPGAKPVRAGAAHRAVARRRRRPGGSPVAHRYRAGALVAAHPQRILPIGSRHARSPRRSHYSLADGGGRRQHGLAGGDGDR